MSIKTYSELIRLETFDERFEYLMLNGKVGADTFGFNRIFNQMFYGKHNEWKRVRRDVIVRDNGCDLAIPDRQIPDGVKIFVHHLNPISMDDIKYATDYLLNPEFLITTSFPTHQAIHFSDKSILVSNPIERLPNDTCPWRKKY